MAPGSGLEAGAVAGMHAARQPVRPAIDARARISWPQRPSPPMAGHRALKHPARAWLLALCGVGAGSRAGAPVQLAIMGDCAGNGWVSAAPAPIASYQGPLPATTQLPPQPARRSIIGTG